MANNEQVIFTQYYDEYEGGYKEPKYHYIKTDANQYFVEMWSNNGGQSKVISRQCISMPDLIDTLAVLVRHTH